MYFLDDNVFTEAGGFWVRGGAVAEMVLEAPEGPKASFSLMLQNGRTDNSVVIARGAEERRETFHPSETKTIELTSDSSGVVRFSISSPSGFQPSDDGVSRDSRYLGVRVELK